MFDRIRIETLYKEKYSPSQIGKILCRHRSSITAPLFFLLLLYF
ncbi:helix-turn-helix domain-containing protein [Mucispirillum schaedleri]